jgi:hypothetical protein
MAILANQSFTPISYGQGGRATADNHAKEVIMNEGKMELVAVYAAKSANQAEIVKNFLQSEGIFCSVEGEGQVGFAGLLDIKVLVRAPDAERARKLIAEHEDAGDDTEGEE